MGGLPSTPLSPLPLAPQGARLYIRRIKEECVTPLYYSGVIALARILTVLLTLIFALAVTGLARFAVVDWGEVLRGGLEEICFAPERGREDLILGICWG